MKINRQIPDMVNVVTVRRMIAKKSIEQWMSTVDRTYLHHQDVDMTKVFWSNVSPNGVIIRNKRENEKERQRQREREEKEKKRIDKQVTRKQWTSEMTGNDYLSFLRVFPPRSMYTKKPICKFCFFRQIEGLFSEDYSSTKTRIINLNRQKKKRLTINNRNTKKHPKK